MARLLVGVTPQPLAGGHCNYEFLLSCQDPTNLSKILKVLQNVEQPNRSRDRSGSCSCSGGLSTDANWGQLGSATRSQIKSAFSRSFPKSPFSSIWLEGNHELPALFESSLDQTGPDLP